MVDTRKIAIAGGVAALSGAAIFVALRPSGADPCPPGMVRLPSGRCTPAAPGGGALPIELPPELLTETAILQQARALAAQDISIEDGFTCQQTDALRGFPSEFQMEAERVYQAFCVGTPPEERTPAQSLALQSAEACRRSGTDLGSCMTCEEIQTLARFGNPFQMEAQRLANQFCGGF